MPAQTSVQSVGLLIATILCVAMIAMARRRRASAGSSTLIALMFAAALWDGAGAMGAAAVDLQAKVLWAKVQYLGICSAPLLWLRFAFAYSQQEPRLSRRALSVLAIVPTITFLLAATNEAHRLVWSDIALVSDDLGVRAVFSYGPWFWVAASFSYLYLFAGTALMVRSLMRFPPHYLPQTAAVLLGISAPWLANIAYLAKLVPIPGLDITPFAFTLSSVCFFYGLLRLGLLDLVPVARETLIERMDDGLVVLDSSRRVVDVNPAGQRMLGLAGRASLIGRPASEALAGWPSLLTNLCEEAPRETHAELQLPGDLGFADVRQMPLRDARGRTSGVLVVLHDVTERVRQQRRREALLHAVRRLATAAEPHELLTKLVAEAPVLVGGSVACVARWEPRRERLLIAKTDSGVEPTDTVRLGEGALGLTAAKREAVAVSDYSESVPVGLEPPLTGALAVVAAPLLHKNQLLGVVAVASFESETAFTTADAQLLEVLAGMGASALAGLEQARLKGVQLAAKTMEHELNNRLALTVGYSELLEHSPGMPEELRPLATAAKGSAHDASRLVSQLMLLEDVEETHWGPLVGTTIDLTGTHPNEDQEGESTATEQGARTG